MRELINPSTKAPVNLALEEYILCQKSEEYFFIWQDEPAIIVGRNQNTSMEINEEYIKGKDIQVVRRLTGGGAVYHDLGNLNFTMIINDPAGAGFDFARFTRPIIKALAKVGVAAEYTGRNDLTIEGKKFSGNAQYRHRGRLLHHGTLLFDSDLSVLGAALKVKPEKMAAKGVKSVVSRVTNIKEYTPQLSLDDFKKLVIDSLREEYGAEEKPYSLSEAEWQTVTDLTANKYATWAWNYGASPIYNLIREQRFDWGDVQIYLFVESGIIRQVKIYGDFFANEDLIGLEQTLTGVPYERKALEDKISNTLISKYLPLIDNEVFLNLIID